MNPLLKHRIKQCSSSLGLRWREGFARRSSMQAFCQYLRRRSYEPTSIIDVGVADGTFELYTTFPNAHFLLIEPMIEFKGAVNWICSRYNARAEYVAAGAYEGEQTIYFNSTVETMHGATLMASNENANVALVSRAVPVRRLDELVAAHKMMGPYLVKIDTQGTELDVIAGAEGILPEIDVFILETSFFHFCENRPLIHETIASLAARGFVPYEFFGGYNRPLDGALGQVDVAFVRQDGPFRADDRYNDDTRSLSKRQMVITAMRRLINA
jgi:FkbM family methyltransferase